MTTDELIALVEENSLRYEVDYARTARKSLCLARLNALTTELNVLQDMLSVKGLPVDVAKVIKRKMSRLTKTISELGEP